MQGLTSMALVVGLQAAMQRSARLQPEAHSSQEVVWHCPFHLSDACALGRCMVKLDNLVVHVLVDVHDGRLVATPEATQQGPSGS